MFNFFFLNLLRPKIRKEVIRVATKYVTVHILPCPKSSPLLFETLQSYFQNKPFFCSFSFVAWQPFSHEVDWASRTNTLNSATFHYYFMQPRLVWLGQRESSPIKTRTFVSGSSDRASWAKYEERKPARCNK